MRARPRGGGDVLQNDRLFQDRQIVVLLDASDQQQVAKQHGVHGWPLASTAPCPCPAHAPFEVADSSMRSVLLEENGAPGFVPRARAGAASRGRTVQQIPRVDHMTRRRCDTERLKQQRRGRGRLQ